MPAKARARTPISPTASVGTVIVSSRPNAATALVTWTSGFVKSRARNIDNKIATMTAANPPSKLMSRTEYAAAMRTGYGRVSTIVTRGPPAILTVFHPRPRRSPARSITIRGVVSSAEPQPATARAARQSAKMASGARMRQHPRRRRSPPASGSVSPRAGRCRLRSWSRSHRLGLAAAATGPSATAVRINRVGSGGGTS